MDGSANRKLAETLKVNIPVFEDTIMKMDEHGLISGDQYPESLTLRDAMLFFVDTFKFALRLLQASETAKSKWKSFLQKSSHSKDALKLFDCFCFSTISTKKLT
jgi:hypothetical protein